MNETSFMCDGICPPDRGEIADWFTRSAIASGFDVIDQNVDFAIQSIENEQKEIEAAASRAVQGLSDDEEMRHIYYQNLYDANHRILAELPQIQLRSSFIMAYSYFEHTLEKLCLSVKERKHLESPVKQKHSMTYVESMLDYLVGEAGVKDAFISEELRNYVLFLGRIRNVIVHSHGVIDLKQEKHNALQVEIKQSQMMERSPIQCESCLLEKDKKKIMLTYFSVKESVSEFRKVAMAVCHYPLYADRSMLSE